MMEDDEPFFYFRDEWPPGEWDSENDIEEWETKAGLPGLARRSRMGMWCGYAGVDSRHAFFEKGFSDLEDMGVNIEVHGGLTYGGHIYEWFESEKWPLKRKYLWWLGFDCGHYMDIMPSMLKYGLGEEIVSRLHPEGDLCKPIYKNISYVKAEVEMLAVQLAELA